MDFVMRIFIDECRKKKIGFTKFEYAVNDSVRSREERGTNSGVHDVRWVGYADDLALFFENKKDMEPALKLLDEVFCKYQLSINVSKTKSMIFNFNEKIDAYPTDLVKLNGQVVENVKTFTYLGSKIAHNQPSTGDKEVDQRCNSAQGAYNKYRSKLVNFKIDLQTRVLLLNALCRSRLCYGGQIWNLTKLQSNRINSQYIRFLRGLLPDGFKRKRHNDFALKLTNNQVLKICGCESIDDFAHRLQTRYLAHLARQPNKTMSKQLLFNIDKNKKAGNSLPTFEEQVIKRIYQSTNCSETFYNHKRTFYTHANNRTENSLLPNPESKKKHKKHNMVQQQSWSEAEPHGAAVRRD